MKVGRFQLDRVYAGDALALTRQLPDESIHCIVTSPPYWTARNYGDSRQWGNEPTPEEYTARMAAFFAEARRVLRRDGTLWLNLGDCYAGTTGHFGYPKRHPDAPSKYRRGSFEGGRPSMSALRRTGLKDKDLIGIPWRTAFALQGFSVVHGGAIVSAVALLARARVAGDWGLAATVEATLAAWSRACIVTGAWWHRTEIIWAKTNATPERVPDRPTRGHEFVFLLARSPRYFFDVRGILEPRTGKDKRFRSSTPGLRRMRTYWLIPKGCYPGRHIAPFPPRLVEPCIRAGTSEKGCCPRCGAPWVRQKAWRLWRPGCECGRRVAPVPCVVLDPFAGSGTTGVVALRLGRAFLGFDLAGGQSDQGGFTVNDRLRAAAAGAPEPWQK